MKKLPPQPRSSRVPPRPRAVEPQDLAKVEGGDAASARKDDAGITTSPNGN